MEKYRCCHYWQTDHKTMKLWECKCRIYVGVYKFWTLGSPGNYTVYGCTLCLLVLGVELASCHHFGTNIHTYIHIYIYIYIYIFIHRSIICTSQIACWMVIRSSCLFTISILIHTDINSHLGTVLSTLIFMDPCIIVWLSRNNQQDATL